MAGTDKGEGADVAVTQPGWAAEQDNSETDLSALCRLGLWGSVPDSVPFLSLPKAWTTSLCFSKGKTQRTSKDQQGRTESCFPSCFVIFPLKQIVKFQEKLSFFP